MSWIEQFHGRYVASRRANVLARGLAHVAPAGASVLDVGCGDGEIASLFQQRRPDAVIRGVDVLVRANTRVPVAPFDGHVLPFEDGSFDVVSFIDVLHHCDWPLELLCESRRVAKTAIVIKDHVLQGFAAQQTLRFMDGVGNRRYGVALPFNYWRRDQWSEAFKSLGLSIEHWDERLGLYPWPLSLAFDRRLHFLARWQFLRLPTVPRPIILNCLWRKAANVATATPPMSKVSRRSRWRAAAKHFLHRPWLAAAALMAASLATSSLISVAHWPQPATHDEFSYLLAADTFCEGRLTNPTHAMWPHFESFHIIHEPTYATKYPPGQGAALAVGQWATGAPLVGVWLETALAAAALYWMLLGFTTPRWALFGGVLWLAQPNFQLAWGQSYWGGTLAFTGGSLVFGAAMRMTRRMMARDASAMAIGTVLLATTRPFEGALFCSLVGAWVVWHWARHAWPPWRELALKCVLPQALILGLGLGALARYNAAVTGDPFTMPYVVHERIYGQCPVFFGQAPTRPTYRHPVIEDFHSNWAMDWYRWQSTWRRLLFTKFSVTLINLEFFFSIALGAGFLMVRPLRWRRLTPVLAVAGLTYAFSLITIWNMPHYTAAIAPLLMLAATAGLRRADVMGQRCLPGMRIGTGLVVLQVGLFAMGAVKHASRPYAGWWDIRAAITAELNQTPGRDLVLVRYGDNHITLQEWVYNNADIDAASVVWARSMDPASDAKLCGYFRDRKAWLLEPEAQRMAPLPSVEESLEGNASAD